MIPCKNREKFLRTYGEYWYLREFDYLPESLLDYNKNISPEFMKDVKSGNRFDLFPTREEALAASYQIRGERGLTRFIYNDGKMI